MLKRGGKAEEVIAEAGAIFLEQVDWEMQEQQVVEKLEVRTEAHEGPVPLNLDDPVMDSLEAIQWELRPGVPRPTGPICSLSAGMGTCS